MNKEINNTAIITTRHIATAGSQTHIHFGNSLHTYIPQMPSSDVNKQRRRSSTIQPESARDRNHSRRSHRHHDSHNRKDKNHGSDDKHRRHRQSSSPSTTSHRKGGWFVWNGFSPCVIILIVVLFVVVFGIVLFGFIYSSSAWAASSSTTATVTAVVMESQQQQPIAGGATISIPLGSSIEPPRIDRPYMAAQIAALMDYYQRVNANVTGMNSISRHCYDRMVLDPRFKQMTTALNEMFRLDVCLSETTEDIIYKAKTWYGFAPKKDGVDIVEALYCTNCN